MTFETECAILKYMIRKELINRKGKQMSRIKTLVPETVNEFDEIDFNEQ